MNRFLRTAFICVAALSGVGVVLLVCDLQAAGLPVMRAKTLWVLLIGTALVIGLYPRLLLDLIVPSFDSTLFEGLRKAGGF